MSQITLVVAVMTKLYFMPIIRFNSSLMTAPQIPFRCCLKEEKNLGLVSDVIGNIRFGFQEQLAKIEGEQNITKSNAM